MRYEVLEHPAELRICVYGKTLEELFSNAAFALAEILKGDMNYTDEQKDVQKVYHERSRREIIKIESVDINSLLVDFLSEVLAKSQINKCMYEVAKIKINCHPERSEAELRDLSKNNDEIPRYARNDNEKCFLQAELISHSIDKFDEDIKAVTYEDLDIKKIDGIWQTMIVFDI